MKETECRVVSNREIAEDVFELTLFDEKPEDILPGQFVNVKIPAREDLILRRPFGIAKFDRGRRTMTLCYQLRGEGTRALAAAKEGSAVKVTYPLGNGFRLKEGHRKIMLVGGGVGVFPLLCVPHCHPAKYYAFLGYRNKASVVYAEEFERVCEHVHVATEDGSFAMRGYATDSVAEAADKIKPDIILGCGPMPMFRSLSRELERHRHIPCLVSVEERMGCGIGACLVCVCRIKGEEGVTHKRVCADGPVFNLSEVVFDE